VFGLTALDELGNESDIITLDVPYQFNVPKMPEDLWIETMEELYISGEHPDPEQHSGPTPLFEEPTAPDEAKESQTAAMESEDTQTSLKYIRGRDNK
jgi:hypothetical protein